MRRFFKKQPPDPISSRSRELNQEIAELEEKIRRLATQLEASPPPRLRPPALPSQSGAHPKQEKQEIVFEPVDQGRLKSQSSPPAPEMLNELGTRKVNPSEWLQRIKSLFKGSTTTTNPKLFKYLAAGNIQGLRPLRYEKRVARNRFFLWTAILVLVLWGLVQIFRK
jgi:hypothetical protein